LDFVDVNTEEDLQLFIDPYVFSKSSDAWSVICHEAIVSFFQSVLDAVRRGDDAAGRALLDNLGEPNETCLGLSTGTPAGRGIGRLQADELFDRLRRSRAARTGLLSELSDCELFIVGIGSDKVSDITTNIIRRNLIEYTQAQCELHGVPLVEEVASGMIWDGAERRWTNRYVSLPVINGQKLIFVPKSSVRWKLAFSHQDYYNQFVLEFLQAENLRQDTALVETLRNGRRRVTKKRLKEIHPLAKDFLAGFSERNPRVLETYKKLLSVSNGLANSEIDDQFNEVVFAQSLISELPRIDPGNASASQFHAFMIGAIEFVFYPDLIYPVKEDEINEGRKRIDITYTNNAASGFFFRRHIEAHCNAVKIMVECKNYQKEMANPELDQMAGRFSRQRGRFGILIGRTFDDRNRFVARCRDTAKADNGFILPLVDLDILQFLQLIVGGKRHMIDIDLERRFAELIN
jgi:hypothetical protein